MSDAKEILSEISDLWFMSEPFLFNVLCTHSLKENKNISCMFRTGRGNIEYNPDIVISKNKEDVQLNLKVEIVRIILKHPYQRVPDNPEFAALTTASDITLSEHCNFKLLKNAGYYNLENKLAYEEYYKKLKFICPSNEELEIDSESFLESIVNSASNQNKMNNRNKEYLSSAQQSELWENNEMMSDRINGEIIKAEMTNLWGSISGDLIQEFIASVKIPMDYRRILSQFRSTIISQQRKLTRMKPNRRYGFDFMGSKFEPKTKLMVAIDVSGSISDKDIQHFISIINQFFSYGLESVQLVAFDCEITMEIEMKKAKNKIKITGRGGTNFQPVIDRYLGDNAYEGLIIFTDGEASFPEIKKKKDILWILTGKEEYNNAIKWIKELKCKATWIPKV